MFKKFMFLSVLTFMFSLAYSFNAFAADFTIDKTNAENGTIEVVGVPGAKTVKVRIEKGGTIYDYVVSKVNSNVYPLQLGNGTYNVMVLENIAGKEYTPLLSEQVTVSNINETKLYTSSIQQADYADSKTAVPELTKLIAAAGSEQEKVDAVYNYIINNIAYDFDKAGNAAALVDYLPVPDNTYSSKKGICYDYASLLASALRKNGIPCKLQMGYCAEIPEYHAWNEVYVGGSWFKIDTTYDAQVVKANLEVTMQKSNDSYSVSKFY